MNASLQEQPILRRAANSKHGLSVSGFGKMAVILAFRFEPDIPHPGLKLVLYDD